MNRQLIDYLPNVLKTYKEFEELLNAEQPQMNMVWLSIESLIKEAFIMDETEIGAAKWEKIMKIQPLDTDSLELRNFRIHGRMLEDSKITWRTLCSNLETLCGKDGYTAELQHDKYTLKIRVALKSKKMKDEVCVLCERIVPLNLILDIELMYNTHRMIKDAGLTYGQLEAYTHKQIKDEPFI